MTIGESQLLYVFSFFFDVLHFLFCELWGNGAGIFLCEQWGREPAGTTARRVKDGRLNELNREKLYGGSGKVRRTSVSWLGKGG